MRCVITVIGKDTVGILAKVSALCAKNNINIIEVTQSILQEIFCMNMLVDTTNSSVPFLDFSKQLKTAGEKENLVIHAMHEDIFNSMHRI